MKVFWQSDSRAVPRCDFLLWHHRELHAGKSLTRLCNRTFSCSWEILRQCGNHIRSHRFQWKLITEQNYDFQEKYLFYVMNSVSQWLKFKIPLILLSQSWTCLTCYFSLSLISISAIWIEEYYIISKLMSF